jgi:hypothetical protein
MPLHTFIKNKNKKIKIKKKRTTMSDQRYRTWTATLILRVLFISEILLLICHKMNPFMSQTAHSTLLTVRASQSFSFSQPDHSFKCRTSSEVSDVWRRKRLLLLLYPRSRLMASYDSLPLPLLLLDKRNLCYHRRSVCQSALVSSPRISFLSGSSSPVDVRPRLAWRKN